MFFSCVCMPVIVYVGELHVCIHAFVYMRGGMHAYVQCHVCEYPWVVCVHMYVPVNVCHITHEEVRGHLVVDTVLSLYHVCSWD